MESIPFQLFIFRRLPYDLHDILYLYMGKSCNQKYMPWAKCIDLAARLFGLSGYDAAKKLAADFGITGQKPSILARLQRGKSQAEAESRSFRVLGDYLQILRDWKENCAPQSPEDAIDPRYTEACHMVERIENMLDILTCGTPQERAEVVADMQKDNRLMRMEARNRQIREDEDGTK